MSETADLVARIGNLNNLIKIAREDTMDARCSGDVRAYIARAEQLASLRAQRVELRVEKMKLDARGKGA